MANLTTAAIMLNGGADEVKIRPRGHSMEPVIKDGELVVVRRMDHDPEPGEIVLVKVAGHTYLHKVLAVDGERVQIGSMKRVNGWTHRTKIYGYVAKISDKPRRDVSIRNGKYVSND